MAWIKRNLFFVISMVAGLILTVYCGCLFAIDLKKSAQVDIEYQQNAVRLNQLIIRPLFPSEANITRAKDDRSRLEAFRAEVRTNFAPFPTPPKEDEKGFSTYLEDTITGLKAKAEENAVILPDGMAFGFTDQRGKLNYHAECIQPWMQQLTEIKALCDILFGAKINSLAVFRRVPVSSNDVFLTPTDSLPAKIITNQLETITPYKIEFRGFTRELAAVMKGLAESSNCYVINNVVVRLAGQREGELTSPEQTPAPTTPVPTPPPGRRGGTATPPRRGTTTAPGTSPVTPPAPNPPARGRGTRRGAATGMGGMEGMAGLEPAAPILVGAAAAPMPPMPGMPAAPPAAGGVQVPPARGTAPVAPAGGRPPAAASGGAASYAPGTVLREQLLLIMISVETIRFN